MLMTTLGADIDAATAKFFSSLDRSALGRFAVDEHLLRLQDQVERCRMVGNASVYEVILMKGLIDAGLGNAGAVAVRQELLFWWWKSMETKLVGWITRMKEPELYGAFHRLSSVTYHPDMHDYFAAGLWNVTDIHKYMDAGIDAELAASFTRQ